MSKTDSVKPTTAVKEWAQLADTGLKEHSIQFELSQHCHERILQAFLKLTRVGYELHLFQRGEGGKFCNFAGPYTLKDKVKGCLHTFKDLHQAFAEGFGSGRGLWT